jgi:isopenicillin-N epimerase
VKGLFLLDPDVVFLNHGSFGACPRPVFEEYQRWQRELERQPVEFLALERRFPELLDGARVRLAAYVGADAGDLAFAPNATTAINAVVRSLALEPGDEVLLGDAEYGGLELLWQYIARRTGARLVRRPFPELDPGARTRVLFCSHVEWTTGRVNDVGEICRRAREAGALSIVDGAHAPGQVDLDLASLGADVYAGNCHKWLCAPKGAGFLYVAQHVQETVDGAITSWGYEEPATFISRTQRQGTRDSAAYLAVPDAIAFVREHNTRDRCVELARRARRALCDLVGTEPIAPEEQVLQMASVRLPYVDPDLQRRLFAEHRIEIPISDDMLMRISIAMYNTEEDVERLLDALSVLLKRSARSPA